MRREGGAQSSSAVRNEEGMAIHHHETAIDIAPPAVFTGGLEFSELTYTVSKKQKVGGGWETQEVDLLRRITGYAPKGRITAVMGPSGAGKSTFLDGLAGRIASGSLKGRVSLDGEEMSPGLIKRVSAYVMQDDRLFPMLTVYETFMFAADFRLGSIPRSQKKQRVEQLIEQLGLTVYICGLVEHLCPSLSLRVTCSACSRRGTRTSATKARAGCREASGGGYRSAWTSSTGRRCCSWTSPRRGSTPPAPTA